MYQGFWATGVGQQHKVHQLIDRTYEVRRRLCMQARYTLCAAGVGVCRVRPPSTRPSLRPDHPLLQTSRACSHAHTCTQARAHAAAPCSCSFDRVRGGACCRPRDLNDPTGNIDRAGVATSPGGAEVAWARLAGLEPVQAGEERGLCQEQGNGVCASRRGAGPVPGAGEWSLCKQERSGAYARSGGMEPVQAAADCGGLCKQQGQMPQLGWGRQSGQGGPMHGQRWMMGRPKCSRALALNSQTICPTPTSADTLELIPDPIHACTSMRTQASHFHGVLHTCCVLATPLAGGHACGLQPLLGWRQWLGLQWLGQLLLLLLWHSRPAFNLCKRGEKTGSGQRNRMCSGVHLMSEWRKEARNA